jgi:hypothetical protein
MSSRRTILTGLRVLLFPFELFYRSIYLSCGWIFQLLYYVYLRNYMTLHDLFFTLSSIFRFRGDSFSRTVFLLKSRLRTPKHLYSAFRNRTETSESLPDNWESIRKSVLERDGFSCVVCGAENLELHVDHILPRKWNGSHRKENLRTLCRHCHRCRHFRKL